MPDSDAKPTGASSDDVTLDERLKSMNDSLSRMAAPPPFQATGGLDVLRQLLAAHGGDDRPPALPAQPGPGSMMPRL
jgi:hypothetical protein